MIIISHSFDRIKYGGININRIVDKKFSSGSVSIKLFAPYTDKTAPALAILPSVLCACNADYPTQEALTKRLNELYGGNIWGSCSQLSDMLELNFCCDFILDKYALDGEKVALPTAGLLLGCLLNPLVVGDGFDTDEFEVRKQDLLDAIDSEINERSSYALTVAYETVYKGETSAKRHYFSREAVEALTPQSAYEVYKDFIQNSKIKVSICSGELHSDVEALIADVLSEYGKSDTELVYYTPSPAKDTPEYAACSMDVKQANIVLAFKTKSKDYLATRLMSMIYGESPTSKLTLTVREKMSLCYYCQSGFSETKNTMVVVSGVDYANISATQQAVVSILLDMARGEFSDSELSEAKLFFTSRLRSRLDRKGSLIDWYLREELNGNGMSIYQAIDEVNSITRERIIAAAESFKLDTVFTLGKEKYDD